MLKPMEQIRNTKIRATDGDIGHVEEFYFDDEHWGVRYMVVDTAAWIFGRKVLVSPYSVRSSDWDDSRVEVNLTKDQIKNSPDIDTKQPISRLQEREYNRFYGIPYYWGGTGMWGNAAYPAAMPVAVDIDADVTEPERKAMENTHLRSSKEVTGYTIHATDGELGHLEDFVVDDDAWAIRYIIVDTKNFLSGKKVILSTDKIESVDWVESEVYVSLTKAQIKNAPEYDPDHPITRDYEVNLHKHYGGEVYW